MPLPYDPKTGVDWMTVWNIVKLLPGPDLRPLQALFEIPNIEKYVTAYLDWRNIGAIPFIGPVPRGPAPEGCSEHELIIARGTGEVGPFGFIVGDPILERVQQLLPDVQGYSVQYPANIDSNSWQIGVKDVVDRLNNHSKKCPQTKFGLVGYSQGALIMHVAASHADMDPKVLRERVVGGAMFGDPYLSGGKLFRILPMTGGPNTIPKFPALLESKMKNSCAKSWEYVDPVCANEDLSLNIAAHLTYNNRNTTYMKDSAVHLARMFWEHKPAKRAVRRQF